MLLKLPTQFAPADRLETLDVQLQAAELLAVPLAGQLLRVVPEPVVVLNRYRQILYANEAFRQVAGKDSAEALIGMRPGEALDCTYSTRTEGGCGTTEFCRKCGAALSILKGLTGRPGSQDCTILRTDGEALELQVWSQPVELEGRSYLFVFFSDRSNEKRRRLLERLFFHDVLNTAGGVYGFADLLREALPSDDEHGTFAKIIFDLSAAVIDEIEAQKQLAAAECNELLTRFEDLGCRDLVQDVALSYRAHDVARGKTVAVAPDAAAVRILSDRTLLRRVLGNLLKNALEASTPGQTVTLDCREEGDGVRFTVHNESAMPRDTQLQVFKRSFSTKGSGRGIGTYSVKLLGETYLKGRVGFSSSPEEGTTFWIWLPTSG